MRLEQIRYAQFEKTVLGFILVNGRKTILTLEDSEEMVDTGFYYLEPHNGNRFKNTWCLIGSDSSHYPEVNIDRSTILYHGGDTHEDTTGCVLVGHRFHFNNQTPDIDGSAEAMKLLRDILSNNGPHFVNITERIFR